MAVIAAFGLLLAACGGPAGEQAAPETAEPVRVFAAASLTDVMGAVADAYAATGEPRPVLNFAASSDLARQIEQGADADVFMSADEAWMDYLDERKLIDPVSRRSLLGNTLVMIAPADAAFTLELAPGGDLAGALNGGTLALADPDSVPAGRYAKEALTWMGAWDSVAGKVARTESVRAALRFVEAGEAAAGIVYGTDAAAAGDKVAVVGIFPGESHTPVTYPVALVQGGNESTPEFGVFLASDEAGVIFEAFGFAVIQ